MESNSKYLLKQLSNSLNLNYESQDWGIINADPNRIEEFISYYEENNTLHTTQKFELQELILASFNDALDERILSLRVEKFFQDFIIKNREEMEFQLKYWSSLNNSKEFPLADYLAKFLLL